MKYILIIGDGMADDPLETLGGKTPLEAAQKPFMDELAKQGTVGLVQTIPDGFAPGSDTAIMPIFGCDPRKYYSGRAPLELAAAGRVLPEGAAAYRCNMVTLEEEGGKPMGERRIISHSAGSIEGAESDELIEWLFSHPDFAPLAEAAGMSVVPGSSFRHLAIQQGGDVEGICLAPPHDHLDEVCGPLLPHGNANAAVLLALMEKAMELLPEHPVNVKRRAEGRLPANCVWFWAEGKGAVLPNFPARYGAAGGVISAVPLCHGIARLVGLEPISVEGATGEWDTNYAGKAEAAARCLEKNDFVAIHVEAPDEATHNHDLEHKISSIGNISEDVLRSLCGALRARNEAFRVLVLSDHRTYMKNGAHGGAPVPYLLFDSRDTEHGCGLPYSEASGEKGPFLADGTQLMPALFQL